MFNEKDKLYTTTEVAEMLQVRLQTIGNWCRTGKLKAKRVGRGWRIPASELSNFMNIEPGDTLIKDESE